MAVTPDINNLDHTQSLTFNPSCLSDPSDIASHLRSACFLPEGDPIPDDAYFKSTSIQYQNLSIVFVVFAFADSTLKIFLLRIQ